SDDRIAGDNLTLAYGNAQFSDAEVGSGKSIEVHDITANGSDAGNYVWNSSAQATANISGVADPDPGSDPEPSPTFPLSLDGMAPEMKGTVHAQFAPAAAKDDRLLINYGIRLPD